MGLCALLPDRTRASAARGVRAARALVGIAWLVLARLAWATPEGYTLDPEHTHPSFEVDHGGGLSVWRGIFKTTSGTIVLDPTAHTGTVDITIDPASIEFGIDGLNRRVAGPEMLDAAQYPTAHYHGTLGDFVEGRPTTVTGALTLHGVTKPVNLRIESFKCVQHPLRKKLVCGANATGTFSRADFGVTFGAQFGFDMQVLLRIQVEAFKDD